ncbi:MAG: hypothetical protein M3Z54_01025 [Gemmatimonadota bacterium]|nr:hypothetical protein [Gemmatimonadota bacterium]
MTPFVLALLAKLTLILVLGLAITATLRSISPSLRHLILFATIVSGLVFPVAMLVSPRWSFAVLPVSSSPLGRAFGLATNQRASGLSADARASNDVGNVAPSGSALSAAVVDAGEASSSVRATFAALPLLPLLWALGFLAVTMWLAIGRFRLHRIAGSSWPLNGADWTSILDEERRDAGVSKAVLLCSSSVVSTPLTWGSRAPVILLPEDALDWPEAHRRVVLRHELAHVARNDSFAQLVAGFICALYWFHPLVWVAERRLRAECERACDDTVVSLGTPPAEYAAHLLEVARSARAFGAPGFLSVAMARPSQLEGRLLAVLNESRRRVALSRGARPAAAILSALVLLPLAAFRAVPRSDPQAKAVVAESELPADTTFQLSAPAQNGGTLTLNLKTGGRVVILGWDKPRVSVRAGLGGRDWRETRVTLERTGDGARLESRYSVSRNNQNSRNAFEINVPRNFNVSISSAGGALTITGVNGVFTGETGGGEITIDRSSGQAHLQTGGGDIQVSNSHLNGNVSTGGGVVRMENVTGNLNGATGSGPVGYIGKSGGVSYIGVDTSGKTLGIGGGIGSGVTTTTTYTDDSVGDEASFGASGVRMSSGGGAIFLPVAPNGAHVTTGGGAVRVGPSGGEVYASTGGGPIDIGPATGSVYAHTGAGNVTIEVTGAGTHTVNVTSGKGQVALVLPPDLNATLDLETAYTDNLGHKTNIVGDWPVQTTETPNWDSSQGTPRRYIRARQNIGRGGGVIRVRTVNGNIVLTRGR